MDKERGKPPIHLMIHSLIMNTTSLMCDTNKFSLYCYHSMAHHLKRQIAELWLYTQQRWIPLIVMFLFMICIIAPVSPHCFFLIQRYVRFICTFVFYHPRRCFSSNAVTLTQQINNTIVNVKMCVWNDALSLMELVAFAAVPLHWIKCQMQMASVP